MISCATIGDHADCIFFSIGFRKLQNRKRGGTLKLRQKAAKMSWHKQS
jgi:hypothetical protein